MISTPLIADIDSDGDSEIILTTCDGDLHMLSAQNGEFHTTNSDPTLNLWSNSFYNFTQWPQHVGHGCIHSSPILFDIDVDGSLDILVVTTSGYLTFYSASGQKIGNYSLQLKDVTVPKNWRSLQSNQNSRKNIVSYGVDNEHKLPDHFKLRPHVLSTPVLHDINLDGSMSELLLAVNYYNDKRSNEDVTEFTQDEFNVLISALVLIDLNRMKELFITPLDISEVSSSSPAFIFSTPTIAQLNPHTKSLQILTATASGLLIALSSIGEVINGFPLSLQPVHNKVIVEYLTPDDRPYIIVVSLNGVVSCYTSDARLVWTKNLRRLSSDKTLWGDTGVKIPDSITITRSALIVDLNHDDVLELLITADEGLMWLLDAASGDIIDGWPLTIGGSSTGGPPTILSTPNGYLLVSLDNNGDLSLFDPTKPCISKHELGIQSYASILSHDILPANQNVELLVAGANGTLFCLTLADSKRVQSTSGKSHYWGESSWIEYLQFLGRWTGLSVDNDFTILPYRFGLMILDPHVSESGSVAEVSTSSFQLTVKLRDTFIKQKEVAYDCTVSLGRIYLARFTAQSQQTTSVRVPSPDRAGSGHIVVECHSQNGRMLRAAISIKFYTSIMASLQWIVVCPSLCLLVFLLFTFGFPKTDLLPVTLPTKQR